MKSWFLGALMAAVALAFVPSIADAKRLGGGASKGMQRSTPTQPAQNTPPSTAPAPATAGAAAPAAAGAAAAAGKRSWMGPIAGLAAGLGIAALFSHLGLGEELANFVMIALLVLVAFMAFRFFMSRRAGAAAPRMATAAAGAGNGMGGRSSFEALQPAPAPVQSPQGPAQDTAQSLAQPTAFTGLAIGSGVAAAQLPADFDRPAFERLAKMIFIRLQAANDAADVNDLRNFTTPELFADLRLDLQERGPSAQHTDVQDVNAEVLDFAQEPERQVVSVRFHGRIVESEGAEPEAFDEIWHLVKPVDDSRNWAIAGIQQRQ